MIKANSKVLVGSSKSKGVVKELDELVGSILVVHKVMLDGREKEIEQWYSQDAVTEVIEEAEKKVESSKKTKTKGDKKVEFGVMPEKSDSDGK